MEYLPAFDAALNEIINPESSNRKLKSEEDFYHVGLDGSFGANEISPRSINAKFIGKLVCLEAIVTRCSIVRPKILRSVHYCEKTKMYHSRDYRDATMSGNSIPTSTVYPKEVIIILLFVIYYCYNFNYYYFYYYYYFFRNILRIYIVI